MGKLIALSRVLPSTRLAEIDRRQQQIENEAVRWALRHKPVERATIALQVARLVDLVLHPFFEGSWRLSYRNGRVYVTVLLGDNIPTTCLLRLPKLRTCLADEYRALYERTPRRDAIWQALDSLEANGRQMSEIRLLNGGRQ